MWVLLGVSDDTVEKESFVYFIGVFDDLSLAKEKRKRLISNGNDYIIKPVTVNTSYNYDWSNDEKDDIKHD